MNTGLEQAVAFVAGASSGLGFATAKALLQEGCKVTIVSRNAEKLQKAAEALASPFVLPVVCDVTKESNIRFAIEQTLARFGKLNVLVCNAGGPPTGTASTFSVEEWKAALDLNLMSTIHLCRYALPALRNAAQMERHARILVISSVSAKQPITNLALSNTARAGALGFAKSLAEEVGAEGITVNSLLPGYTQTERLSDLRAAIQNKTGKSATEIEQEWANENTLKRLGTPEEFASAVVYLASKTAGYITGIALPIDGGRTKTIL